MDRRRSAEALVAALGAALLAAGAALFAPAPPALAAAGPALTLRLGSLAPRIVTADGPATLSLTGTVSNTGDRVVRDLELRVQRGPAPATDRELRAALTGAAPADAVTPAFTVLATELAPGQTAPFALQVPVRGGAAGSLAIAAPGSYPLLVNVNGIPDFGGRARLAAVRLLLPVTGLPATSGAPAVPAPAAPSVRIGLLYPLVDAPHRLPTGPDEPALLTDDQLASALAPGGRLAGLLAALQGAAPAGSAVADATCLVVDPDLLATVAAMADGYRVRTPGGVLGGRGAVAAAHWLDALRSTVRGRCVLSLPYADADLVAMSRGNLADLASYARVAGARVSAEVLGTAPVSDTTWPADGLLEDRTLSDVSAAGGRALVLAPENLAGGVVPAAAVTRLAGSDVTVLVTDPLVAVALAGVSTLPPPGVLPGVPSGVSPLGLRPPGIRPPAASPPAGSPSGTSVSTGTGVATGTGSDTPAGTAAPLAAQDALGALVYRTTATTGGRTRVVLAAPPRRWQVDDVEAKALLEGVGRLVDTGLAAPADVAALATGSGATGDTPVAALAYPLQAGARELPVGITAAARQARDQQRDLFAATEQDRVGSLPPAALFEPVEADLLRGLSAAWRPQPAIAAALVAAAADRVAALRSQVDVVQPSGPYTLASNDAPLLVSVENRLPVAVDARLELSQTPGLRTDPVPMLRVPAQGRIQVRVNTEVSRSGQFTVEARATTPSGDPLGQVSRLLLRSTAYGTITVWLTGFAGLLLVLLAGRRIVRRVRGSGSGRHRRPGAGGRGGAVATPDTGAPAPTAPSGTR